LALAIFVLSALRALTAEDQLLLGGIKLAVEFPELLWQEAARAVKAPLRKWRSSTVRALMDNNKFLDDVTRLPNPEVAALRQAVAAWAEARAGAAGVACATCNAGVVCGVACGACAHAWHFGCWWAQLADRRRTDEAPPLLKNGIGTVTCHLCRQGHPVRGTATGSLLTSWRAFVDALEIDAAVELVDRALEAGPARRRLPGSGLRKAAQTAGRYLATAAVSILCDMVSAGDRAAEILLMFAPRLFMRKGTPISDQLHELVAGRLGDRRERPPGDPNAAWVAAMEGTLEAGGLKKLAATLERGPKLHVAAPDEAEIRAHYPTQKVTEDFIKEEGHWRKLRATIVVARTVFTSAELRKWARTHLTSSGGSTGWTGALLLHMQRADGNVGVQLARLWARAPHEWLMAETARTALRRTDGWPIRKGHGIRPIAAPQVVRRIASAEAMRRARPLVERYCRERGQFGLSGEAHTIAYSLIPLLTVHTGGTVLVADRSMSFQTIRRDAVFRAVKACVDTRLEGEEEAAAALVDACLDYYVETEEVPRSFVGFDGVQDFIDVDGLPQGCSLSPVLEAIVLAWHASNQEDAPAGTLRMAAHDDLALCAEAGRDGAALCVPDCETVGGSYNVTKSAAFGSARDELVQQARATSASEVGSVWGRPVGDTARWFESQWLQRFQLKCERLRHLAQLDPAVAIWTAHSLGGPGSIATHVLRGLPPKFLEAGSQTAERILSVLRQADEQWVDLVCELAGAAKPKGEQRTAVRGLIFGTRLGHVSAQAIARAAAAAGLSVALPAVLTIAAKARMDVSGWADCLGLGELTGVGRRATTPSEMVAMRALLNERAKQAKEDYDDSVVRDDPGSTVNLWVQALRAPTEVHAAVSAAGMPLSAPSHRAISVRYALARALGLPVWEIVGGLPGTSDATGAPPACGLCAAVSAADGATERTGPRATMDPHGEHVGACLRTDAEAWNTTRHNRLVKVAVEIGLQAGIRSQAHDGPVFKHTGAAADRGKRPADWLENGGEDNGADAARYPAGRCYDLTVRTGGAAELEAATKAKLEKYREPLAAHKYIGLTVVGVSYSGCVNKGADDMFRRWAYHLARTRRADADIIGRPHAEVLAAFGLAFATVVAAQAVAYAEQVRSQAAAGSNAARATRCGQRRPGRPPIARTQTAAGKRARSASTDARRAPEAKRVQRAQDIRLSRLRRGSSAQQLHSVHWQGPLGGPPSSADATTGTLGAGDPAL